MILVSYLFYGIAVTAQFFISSGSADVDQQWNEEAQNMGCFDNYHDPGKVQSQVECQSHCKDDSACVGIMYSYNVQKIEFCFICYDDVLISVASGFGFYRKPGVYDLNLGHMCKEGFTPITSNWQHCKTAAVELGFKGDSVGSVDYVHEWGTSRPRGCFQSDDNGRFHFNQGDGGNSVGNDKILCRAAPACKKYRGRENKVGDGTTRGTCPAGVICHADGKCKDLSCPRPPNPDETLTCRDNTKCKPEEQGYDCCVSHGGTTNCPRSKPILCDKKACAGGNDYCCTKFSEYCMNENAVPMCPESRCEEHLGNYAMKNVATELKITEKFKSCADAIRYYMALQTIDKESACSTTVEDMLTNLPVTDELKDAFKTNYGETFDLSSTLAFYCKCTCSSACMTKNDKDRKTMLPPNPYVPCHFPFNWKGKEYTECTMDDHDQKWCGTQANVLSNSTSSLMYGVTAGWGNCDETKECNNVPACDVVSSGMACENNGAGRDASADGNLVACIRSQIAKRNQYAVWWKRRCYGTNTCNSPTNSPGTINYDVSTCAPFPAKCCSHWTAACYTTPSEENNKHACNMCGGDPCSDDCSDPGSTSCKECCQGADHDVAWNCGHYRQILSGSCSSNGMQPITSIHECNAAAKAIGNFDITATETMSSPRPEGCYDNGLLWLSINSENQGNGADSTRHPICKATE